MTHTDTHTNPADRTTTTTLRVALSGKRVLLLAPDTDAVETIAQHLAADDIDVVPAHNVALARARLHGIAPDVVLLCPELEDGTGHHALQVLRSQRAVSSECPAVAFSSKAEPLDRLRALQRGCVDFIALPIFYPELAARLQLAIDRRRPQSTILQVPGGLEIDRSARTVHQHRQPVPVRNLEYELLVTLAGDPARVFTKRELLLDVFGYDRSRSTRTLDSHACRLRNRLREAGGEGYIHNLWGIGYRLLTNPDL